MEFRIYATKGTAFIFLLATSLAAMSAPKNAADAWTIETTLRYWQSDGGTKWAFHNGEPQAGNPTSVLNWRDVKMQSGELVINFVSPDAVLINFEGGIGRAGHDGTILDDDYFSQDYANSLSGPTRFSHTSSELDNNTMKSLRIGIGARLHPAVPRLQYLDLTSGVSYQRENYNAYGVYQMEDPYDQSGTGLLVPYNVKVLTMDVWYTAWDMLHASSRWTLYDKLHMDLEGIIQPYGHLSSVDSHLLRDDITHNTKLNSHAWGWRGRIGVGYDIAESVEVGAGYLAEAFYNSNRGNMVAYFGGMRDTYHLNWETFQRAGWYANVTAKF